MWPTSRPPSIDLFEGLTKWGEVRIRPEHRENIHYIELRRIGKDEQWKPLFGFTLVGGQVMFRLMAQKNERTVVYDPSTNSFSDLAGSQKNG